MPFKIEGCSYIVIIIVLNGWNSNRLQIYGDFFSFLFLTVYGTARYIEENEKVKFILYIKIYLLLGAHEELTNWGGIYILLNIFYISSQQHFHHHHTPAWMKRLAI